jgi:colanic acid/amylovoran biosynthesis glycosyltransferase
MSRPLRIAMFVGSFPVVSETFIVRQITGLIDLGHEVDIYADSMAEADTPIHPEIAKYRLLERTTFMELPPETAPFEMPVWPITGRTWPPGSATSIHNSLRVARALPKFFRCLWKAPRLACQVLDRREFGYQAASLSALLRLATLCRRPRQYDVLHAHFGPVGNSFRFARELWDAPRIVSFHGYDFSTVPRKEGARVYQKLFATADAVTVNSSYTRQQVETLGCPAVKLHKLPVGLDPDAFPFRERALKPGEPVRILTVARLTEIKGHAFVVRAVAKLRGLRGDVHYEIAGDGPLRKELERLVAELGLRAAVTFHGACDSGEVQRLMAEAHLFVLASVSVEGDQEGQGLVLQEAQATGLPVVATNHGALPEGLVPDESGFLVPERNVDALAERLDYLARHPELWPAMGRAGRKLVEAHYDIRRLNCNLVQLYTQSIDDYRNSTRIRKNFGTA